MKISGGSDIALALVVKELSYMFDSSLHKKRNHMAIYEHACQPVCVWEELSDSLYLPVQILVSLTPTNQDVVRSA